MSLKTISFASFNLLNLDEPGLRMYTDSQGYTQAEADAKLAWTAAMLKKAKADVFGFQELWHQDSLAKAFNLAGLANDYTLLAPDNHLGTRIACAAAVRNGLLEGSPGWVTHFPDSYKLQSRGEDPQTAAMSVNLNTFSRPLLTFTIRPRPRSPGIIVYVCHFKSNGPTKVTNESWYRNNRELYSMHTGAIGSALSTIRRTAEATALRIMLTPMMKDTDHPVVVLGDLNDGQDSNTLDILTTQPKFLETLSTGGGDIALYSVQGLQQRRRQ